MTSLVMISKSLISSPNVSGELQTHLFNSLFFPGLIDPQLGVWLRLISPHFQLSELAYYCCKDAGERNKTRSETKDLTAHSTASSMSRSLLASVSSPQIPQGGMEGQMTCLLCSGLSGRRGALSWRNLLFRCKQ